MISSNKATRLIIVIKGDRCKPNIKINISTLKPPKVNGIFSSNVKSMKTLTLCMMYYLNAIDENMENGISLWFSTK